MKLEELARGLAKRYGGQMTHDNAETELRFAGLSSDIYFVERLFNMVENINDEAYRLWDMERSRIQEVSP